MSSVISANRLWAGRISVSPDSSSRDGVVRGPVSGLLSESTIGELMESLIGIDAGVGVCGFLVARDMSSTSSGRTCFPELLV